MTKALILLLTVSSLLISCSSGSSPSNPSPAGPGGAADKAAKDSDFDKMAIGTWQSKNCFQGENGSTARLVFQFLGDGKGKQIIETYANATCDGAPQKSSAQDLTFTVDRYANGAGQITTNGKPFDVIFTTDEKNMTITDVNGSFDFLKVN